MLVAQDHSNHQEVTGHPQHEDGSIQAEEDHLQPMLVYVELLVAAHLVTIEEQQNGTTKLLTQRDNRTVKTCRNHNYLQFASRYPLHLWLLYM